MVFRITCMQSVQVQCMSCTCSIVIYEHCSHALSNPYSVPAGLESTPGSWTMKFQCSSFYIIHIIAMSHIKCPCRLKQRVASTHESLRSYTMIILCDLVGSCLATKVFGASLSEPHINGTAMREFYIIIIIIIIMVRPSREIIYSLISTDINAKYSIAHSHAWDTGRIYVVLI